MEDFLVGFMSVWSIGFKILGVTIGVILLGFSIAIPLIIIGAIFQGANK